MNLTQSPGTLHQMVGASPVFREMLEVAGLVARPDASVVLTGETGSARHFRWQRGTAPTFAAPVST